MIAKVRWKRKVDMARKSGILNMILRGFLLFAYIFSLLGFFGGTVTRICEDGRIESGGSLFGCETDDDSAKRSDGTGGSGIQLSCNDAMPSVNYLNIKKTRPYHHSFKEPHNVAGLYGPASFQPARGFMAADPPLCFFPVPNRFITTVFLLL